MIDAPERIWYEHDSDARFVWLDGGAGVEYVRADLYEASQNAMWERDEQWKRKVAALEQENEDLRKAQDTPERMLSEQIRAEADSGRMGRRQKTMLHEWADEVAALEQESARLREAVQEMFRQMEEWGRDEVDFTALHALAAEQGEP